MIIYDQFNLFNNLNKPLIVYDENKDFLLNEQFADINYEEKSKMFNDSYEKILNKKNKSRIDEKLIYLNKKNI